MFIHTTLRLDDVLPNTPSTSFDKVLFLNRLHSSTLAESPAQDTSQLYIVSGAEKVTEVTVYSNPVFNQTNYLRNLNVNTVEVWLVDSWDILPNELTTHGIRISGRSGFVSSPLVNSTLQTDIDFTSQIMRNGTTVGSIPSQRRFVAVRLSGQTGATSPIPYCMLHVSIKVQP